MRRPCERSADPVRDPPGLRERLGRDDLDVLDRPIQLARPRTAHLVDDIHAIDDLAKDGVLAIEVRRGGQGDEELAAVGAGPAVGHGQDALAGVSARGVELVLELAAVDGLAARARARRVAALDHEARDDAVEDDVVVLVRVGQAGEVLARLWQRGSPLVSPCVG